jgi:hypothetical protein
MVIVVLLEEWRGEERRGKEVTPECLTDNMSSIQGRSPMGP